MSVCRFAFIAIITETISTKEQASGRVQVGVCEWACAIILQMIE